MQKILKLSVIFLSCLIVFISFTVTNDSSVKAEYYIPPIKRPLYRFWSDEYKAHFFTTSIEEKNDIQNNNSNWQYEAIAYRVVNYEQGTCQYGTASEVHRFWSDIFQKHFYTMDKSEKEKIEQTDPNWTYEGIVYCAYENPQEFAPSIPIYRFYSPTFKGHFYTSSESEKNGLIDNDKNWQYEGVAYFTDKNNYGYFISSFLDFEVMQPEGWYGADDPDSKIFQYGRSHFNSDNSEAFISFYPLQDSASWDSYGNCSAEGQSIETKNIQTNSGIFEATECYMYDNFLWGRFIITDGDISDGNNEGFYVLYGFDVEVYNFFNNFSYTGQWIVNTK